MRSRVRPIASTLVRAALAYVLLSLSHAPSALGQDAAEAPEDSNAAYDRAIAEAVDAYERAEYRAALDAFSIAHDLFPNARTHRGLGIVLYALGDHERSIEQLDAALASAVVPLDDELRDQTLRLRDLAAQHVEAAPPLATPEDATRGPNVDADDAPENAPAPVDHRAEAAEPVEEPVMDPNEPLPPVPRLRLVWALPGAAYGMIGLAIVPWALGRSRLDTLANWCASQPGGGCTVDQRNAEWEARHISRLRRASRGLTVAGAVTAVALTVFAWKRSRGRQVSVGVSLVEPGTILVVRF